MPFRLVSAGEEHWIDLILAVTRSLRLFTNDVESGLTEVQKEALVAADFTEATFAGYAAKTLTGGSWTTTQEDPTIGTYAQQTYTRSSTGTAQVVRGYYILRSSDSTLEGYEYFSGPITVTSINDTIVVTPAITLEDDQEATVAARGVVALQTITSSSGGYTSDTTSDFVLNNVDVDSTRSYRVHLNSVCGIAGTGRWIIELWIDGVQSFRIEDRSGTDLAFVTNFVTAWEPSTGTSDLEVRVNEISGTASLDFPGDPTFPRQFWVEDMGARLP